METLEILVSQIFDNRDSYKDIDFIIIMNMLKESYNNLKGIPLTYNDDKGFALNDDGSESEMDSDAEGDMIHSWYDDSDDSDVADDDFWNYNGR